MVLVMIVSIIFVLIGFILMGVAGVLSPKMDLGREKLSAFECGFDPKGTSRIPFSLRFYLIAIIFLVFDVEITFLLPLIPSWHSFSPLVVVSGGLFLLVLLLGTFHEWAEGSLDWKD